MIDLVGASVVGQPIRFTKDGIKDESSIEAHGNIGRRGIDHRLLDDERGQASSRWNVVIGAALQYVDTVLETEPYQRNIGAVLIRE